MNEPAYLSHREYLAGKAAFRRLVEAAGGAAALAGNLRADASTISRAGLPHEMSRFPALDHIMDAEAMAGEPIIARFLASLHGCVVVCPTDNVAPGDFLRGAAEIAVKGSSVVAGLNEALADGRIDAREATSLRAGVRAAQEALAAVDEALAAIERRSMEDR